MNNVINKHKLSLCKWWRVINFIYMKLTYRKLKESHSTHAHTLVMFNGNSVGYYMIGFIDKKWYFESMDNRFSYFVCSTQNEVKSTLDKLVNGEEVLISLHFGLKESFSLFV